MTDEAAVDAALAALRTGLVVAVPTDTVYGLAAVATDAAATGRIFAAKRRPSGVVLPVLVGSLDQARALGDFDAGSCPWLLATRYWPGPLTIVVRRSPSCPPLALGGDDDSTVGLRCPDSPLLRRLCSVVGPLAVTSANLHGEPTPATADEVAALFGPSVAVVLDGGVLGGSPSTVVDCTAPAAPPRVLRAGAIPADDVDAVCGT